jgi:hypothetical protein
MVLQFDALLPWMHPAGTQAAIAVRLNCASVFDHSQCFAAGDWKRRLKRVK